MQRVTGLGGVFFRCADPKQTLAWYREHLGVDAAAWGGTMFRWREPEPPHAEAYTVWSAFPQDSSYFAPSQSEVMLNYRVADLDALLTALRAEGVELIGEPVSESNGKFAWVLDPDGRKVELWEPLPASPDGQAAE